MHARRKRPYIHSNKLAVYRPVTFKPHVNSLTAKAVSVSIYRISLLALLLVIGVCLMQASPANAETAARYPVPAAAEPSQATDLKPLADGSNQEAAMENSPPQQPELLYPVMGAVSIDPSPVLRASPFSDVDENDSHRRTQWQITISENGQSVMTLQCQGHHLTDLSVPGLVLDPLGSYRLQIRYFDTADQPSPWSVPVVFSTGADPIDLNGNRTPDSQEIDTFIDLNRDAIDDRDQTNQIKSIFNHDGSLAIGLSITGSDASTRIVAVESVDPSTVPEPFYSTDEMVFGLLRYKIVVPQNGQAAHWTLHFSEPISVDTPWLRYDSVIGWEDISNEIEIAPDGLRATRSVTDGGPGDSDGVVNGIVVDQIGPLTVANDNAAVSDANSKGSDGVEATTCFIRTIGID